MFGSVLIQDVELRGGAEGDKPTPYNLMLDSREAALVGPAVLVRGSGAEARLQRVVARLWQQADGVLAAVEGGLVRKPLSFDSRTLMHVHPTFCQRV